MTDANTFAAAYKEAAIFTDCGPDNETEGLAWAEETETRFDRDAMAFYAANHADVHAYEDATGSDAGHDLWFTRCGHGCGYWEHAGNPAADRLDTAARALGNIDLYAGVDGKVYAA